MLNIRSEAAVRDLSHYVNFDNFANHIPALQNLKIAPCKDMSVNLMPAMPSDSQADSVSDWPK